MTVSRLTLAIRMIGLLLMLLPLGTCGDPDRAGSDSPPPGMSTVPKEICDEPHATVVQVQARHLVRTVARDESGYEAAHIADAGSLHHRVYLVDSGNSAIVVLDSLGTLLHKWGRKGTGPGEMVDPYALDFDRAGRVFVLDRSRKVHVFDTTGTFLKSVRIPLPSEDFARLSDGSFAFVRSPDGKAKEIAAFEVDSTGGNMRALISIAPRDYMTRPFTGPAFTTMRVVAGPGRTMAIFYPTDNTIDVFKDGTLARRIEGCLPNSVLESYRTQRQRNGGSSQSVAGFLNAVRFDSTGNLLVSRPRRGDFAALSTYGPDGRLVSTRRFTVKEPYGYSHAAAFADDAHVITWNYDGEVRMWSVRPTQ